MVSKLEGLIGRLYETEIPLMKRIEIYLTTLGTAWKKHIESCLGLWLVNCPRAYPSPDQATWLIPLVLTLLSCMAEVTLPRRVHTLKGDEVNLDPSLPLIGLWQPLIMEET